MVKQKSRTVRTKLLTVVRELIGTEFAFVVVSFPCEKALRQTPSINARDLFGLFS